MPLAIVPCYNEADVLPWTLAHLRQQGCDIHLLDNWSTDGSYELAEQWAETRERWPPEGPETVWRFEQQLRRIEEIAIAHRDWVIFNDADEIRRSCRLDETLCEGLSRIRRDGFNAIRFAQFDFPAVDNGYKGDPESYFTLYHQPPPGPSALHIKAWISWGQPVDIHSSGGHVAHFRARALAEECWILKHYAIRSQEQGERKLQQRRSRYDPKELARGWHVHYSGLSGSLLIDPATLRKWPTAAKP
jgi:glycosyltransferase involved in cell wall biosynthesis